MPRKRITLPKDIDELFERGDLAELTAVFDRCALDATTGSSKSTALAQDKCPDDLARWLVAQGADIEFPSRYGLTPLMSRASFGSVTVLLDLGANVEAAGPSGTALHRAAEAGNVQNIDMLIAAGAAVDAHGQGRMTLSSTLSSERATLASSGLSKSPIG